MPREILIEVDLSPSEPTLRHRVLNLNEDLFRLARDDKWMSFPLEQIDVCGGQRIGVKSARRLRQVLAKVEKLIKKHQLTGNVRLSVAAPPR